MPFASKGSLLRVDESVREILLLLDEGSNCFHRCKSRKPSHFVIHEYDDSLFVDTKVIPELKIIVAEILSINTYTFVVTA